MGSTWSYISWSVLHDLWQAHDSLLQEIVMSKSTAALPVDDEIGGCAHRPSLNSHLT